MARWKLATSHYLNTVKPAKWRYTETDRTSQETIEKEFEIPRFLDINDPKCWTNRWGNQDNREGEIIVCFPGKGEKGDIEFLGDPTPDMIPQDEEAEEISASFQNQWSYKPDYAEPNMSQSIVDRSAVPEDSGLTKIAESIAMVAQQNAELIALMAKSERKF